jgi:hypothetical protein
MRIQYSYRLVEKEFHEPWRMSVEKAVEPALKPLIEKALRRFGTSSNRPRTREKRISLNGQWPHALAGQKNRQRHCIA